MIGEQKKRNLKKTNKQTNKQDLYISKGNDLSTKDAILGEGMKRGATIFNAFFPFLVCLLR